MPELSRKPHAPQGEAQRALLAEFQRTRDLALRNEIVLANDRLVRHLARRFNQQVVASFEDLVQVGYVGLIQAVERYDPARESAFSTFATATIVGVIQHFLRDEVWLFEAPRSLRELSLRLSASRRRFQAVAGRVPSVQELARSVNASPRQVRDALELERLSFTYSIEALQEAAEERPAGLPPSVREPGYDTIIERGAIGELLRRLNARERRVIHQRYLVGLTQSETAARLGISQMHVSRLERRALAQLQELARPPR